MNRRPLTPVSNDIDDDHVLTPAHFLYPYLFVNKMYHLIPPQAESYDALRHGWRSSQYLIDAFWTKFKSEYLASLMKRNKEKTSEIKVGQLVIVESTNEAREYWPTGRIIKQLNCDELHGRRFIIRLSNGKEVDRHVSSIIILDT